jgi:hypothetical protein
MSIAIFNISLRMLTFPLMIQAQKSTAKMMVRRYVTDEQLPGGSARGAERHGLLTCVK